MALMRREERARIAMSLKPPGTLMYSCQGSFTDEDGGVEMESGSSMLLRCQEFVERVRPLGVGTFTSTRAQEESDQDDATSWGGTATIMQGESGDLHQEEASDSIPR